MHPLLKVAWGSLGVSLVVAALKFLAARQTGSLALQADALECCVNVAGAGVALLAVRISQRPPDACHPYGYRKAEHVSAIVEALMVLAAAGAILHAVIVPSAAGWQPEAGGRGAWLNGLGTALNAAWAAWLTAAGGRWQSPAVTASGRHLWTDVWTSGGVLAGFALVTLTGWAAADRLVAAAVALHIGATGLGMAGEALGALMDRADPAVTRRIGELVAAHGGGALRARAIRSRRSGASVFAEFELLVPPDLPVREAHGFCERIEAALRAEFGEAVISIHIEPAEAAPAGELLLCA
ncbi:Cobalt-zinc-cadmium resistance protein [Rhodovastum atsumiense]|uniref:Cation transporter n=1 Tax=Rhodovastum atsumiense TaxID=504468 RepID=A0A5M6IP51_9PROT|nr:cation diffusion facilitator family transporter [Rhodovastum atsumiense]KAA5610021.1 cation transporter [Rhodovastum atsumiense]CAH2602994.1 Cobalt-zinc-cadmium resistance protein [Rhodovastum atsumiense]